MFRRRDSHEHALIWPLSLSRYLYAVNVKEKAKLAKTDLTSQLITGEGLEHGNTVSHQKAD